MTTSYHYDDYDLPLRRLRLTTTTTTSHYYDDNDLLRRLRLTYLRRTTSYLLRLTYYVVLTTSYLLQYVLLRRLRPRRSDVATTYDVATHDVATT